jgi:hypothetical protein
MSHIFKVKSPTIMPSLDNIKDEGTKNVVKDINKIIQDTNRDVLDDLNSLYEEGDWTAAFVCGTSGTITLDNAYKTGHYVKIGNQVTVTGYFIVTSVSSPVGILAITGLPFTCAGGGKFYAGVAIHANGLETTGTTVIQGYVEIGTTIIYVEHFTAGVSAAMAADVKAGSAFVISATYFTE